MDAAPPNLFAQTEDHLLSEQELKDATVLLRKLGTVVETVERRRGLENYVRELTREVGELRTRLRDIDQKHLTELHDARIQHKAEIEELEEQNRDLARENEETYELWRDVGALVSWGLAAGAHMSDALPHVSLSTYDMIREAALERQTVREPTQQEMFQARFLVRIQEHERAADAAEVATTVARFSKLEYD